MRAVLPPPFRRAQKTAAQGSPPREAASVPAVCSERRGALRGSTGVRANVTPARAGKGSRTRWSRSWHTDRPRPCGECLLGQPFSVPRSDHPRIRGEKAPFPRTETCRCGAPPRVRGTVLFCVIPVGMPPHGSPPPMRGKVSIDITTISSYRITPAHARKSPQCQTMRSKGQDHPRVCGEKLEPVYQVAAVPGSPPPVRGKDFKSFLHMRFLRITPACAGKRQRKHGVHSFDEDHPRVCGEKTKIIDLVRQYIGSPPPVRGKGALTAVAILLMRITPACAGKRMGSAQARSPGEDHPRLCGEKSIFLPISSNLEGSPPAHAGKSYCYLGQPSCFQDHPRACGEKPHQYCQR